MFLITTTGTLGTVVFEDLGARTFTHPTVAFDLESEYPIYELLESEDLQDAIDNGYITVTDGTNTIDDLSNYTMTLPVYDSDKNGAVDNADKFGGSASSYYLDAGNLFGTLPPSVLGSSIVTDVNGLTGSVTLDSDDVTEGVTNLYYTDTRARQAIGVSASSGNFLNYNSTTGEFSLTALAITDVTVNNTATNSTIYFNTVYTGSEHQEGDTVVFTNTSGGTEIYMHNGGTASNETDFVQIQAPNASDSYIRNLFSGTSPINYNNLTGEISIDQANASTDGYLSSTDWNTFNDKVTSVNGLTGSAIVLDTDDVTEGVTNLYYTDTRARLSITGGTGINYNNTTGEISANINDSATASLNELWSASKIYTEIQANSGKNTWSWGASRKSTNVTDSYLYTSDSLPTNLSPFVVFADSKIKYVSASTETNHTWVAEVRVNGAVGATLSISGTFSGTQLVDVSINQGDRISFYCNGASIDNPNIQALFEEI